MKLSSMKHPLLDKPSNVNRAPDPSFRGFNRQLAEMLAEFANDVYAPLQYTEGTLETAEILDLRHQKAINTLQNEARRIYQADSAHLQGYKIIDSIRCAVGMVGTREYFGCILYKRSELDIYLKRLFASIAPGRVRSIIQYTHDNTLDEIKMDICMVLGTSNPFLKDIRRHIDRCNRERRIVVAFRGTKKTKDWPTNLHSAKTKVPFYPGEAHSGFLNTYLDGRQGIHQTLQRLLPADPRLRRETQVLVTGHSLGAALATLCVADLFRRYPKLRPVCYSFASPRVGDKDFARAFNQRIARSFNETLNSCCNVRVFRAKDMVPDVPAATQGFRHVQNEWSLGKLKDTSGSGGGLMPGPKPHGMAKYRELVQGIAAPNGADEDDDGLE
jgi:hypothetical protein